MGILTQIRQMGKDRFEISFDGEPLCVLSAAVVEEIGAREGQAYEQDEWDEAVEKARQTLKPQELEKCFDAAARILQASDRSRSEVAQRLHRKGFDEKIIDETLEKLTAYGYLDDARYARRIAEQAVHGARPTGRKTAANKLRLRGVPDEIAREALAVADDDTERANALGWANKLRESHPQMPNEKLAQRLYAKGFAYETIRYALRESARDIEEDTIK